MNDERMKMTKILLDKCIPLSKTICSRAIESMPNVSDEMKDMAIILPLVMALVRLGRTQAQIYKTVEDSYLLSVMQLQK